MQTRIGIDLFTGYDLGAHIRQLTENLQKSIESDSSVKNTVEAEYVATKVKASSLRELTLHTDKISVTQAEENIPGGYFPSGFFVDKSKSYPKPVITFHIPFEGDVSLFKARPSTFTLWSEKVAISNAELLFEVINFYDDAELLKRERDTFVSRLENQVTNINKDIQSYNSQLEGAVRVAYNKAKEKFAKQSDILSQLGNPIKE